MTFKWLTDKRQSLLILFCLGIALTQPCLADVLREDAGDLTRELSIPVYRWRETSGSPRGVVIALHGLIMHGGTYDALARELAARGFVVAAPDMRGYGRWYFDAGWRSRRCEVDYSRTFDDIVRLVRKLEDEYPGLPVFLVGESLGADMALRVASAHPDRIDGLILSSPAIKRNVRVVPRIFYEGALIMAKPSRQVDLVPYIKKVASDDPLVVKEIIDDPLSRKALAPLELLRSLNTARGTLCVAERIPADIPVLIIQGSADRMVKANAVVLLLSRLKCRDQTVKWFPNRGHVLLETQRLEPSAVETVRNWLNECARVPASHGRVESSRAAEPTPN